MSQINYTDTKHWLRTARTLTDALPYMQKYAGRRFVIKFGGHAMVDKELSRVFAEDIALLRQVGILPIVVHGGGPQINADAEAAQHREHLRRRPAHHRRADHVKWSR